MTYKLVYSQIVRKKLKKLKEKLTKEFDGDIAKNSINKITKRARELQHNPYIGIDLSMKYGIETDYRDLIVGPNHVFYYIDNNLIIVAEMFNEKEDFICRLFGVSGRTQESIDYWGE